MESYSDIVATGHASNASAFAGGSSGPAFGSHEENLGYPAKTSGAFSISGLSGLTAGKQVQLWPAAAAYTGKGVDIDECQLLDIEARGVVANSTTISVIWSARSRTGGNIKFNYLIGG